ncbi:MAG: RsmB/NOP family class I SAM-dependent RNA methyltransferase [Coriobacteriia bacterium]
MGTHVGLSPARAAVLRALKSVRMREAYIGPLIETEARRSHLEGADHALAVTLARGVVETLGVLDQAIDEHISGKLEPAVRDALRMSAYELLYMRTPARAAVHQGVEAVRSVRKQAAGLANAVLRKLADAAPEFPWGDPETDLAAQARQSGYPEWLARLAESDLGPDAARQMLLSARGSAPLYVRVNPFTDDVTRAREALAADDAGISPSPPDELSFRASDDRALVQGKALAAGFAVVTDAAAQMAPLAVGGHPGGRVVDVGAGRGTKTLALQALSVAAGGPADLIALDIHDYKTRLMLQRMTDLKVPGVRGVTAPVESVPESDIEPQSADAVLLDAPCTGTGTLRRHPEIVWRLAPVDIARLADLQSRLLEASARLVRPGGVVVYSTCSIARAENDAVVQAFLASESGRDFEIDRLDAIVPDEWHAFRTGEGFFRSWPTTDGPDGHFVARLIRTGPAV